MKKFFVFDPLEAADCDLEIADLVMDKVTKHLHIPVFINTQEDLVLSKGDVIGFIKEVDGIIKEQLDHLSKNIVHEIGQIIKDNKVKLIS